MWQTVEKAVPVIDYTIDMTVSSQDMSTAGAKSQVAEPVYYLLLPKWGMISGATFRLPP